MTTAELRSRILQALLAIAPEADPTALRPTISLRDQLDIDSMDLLNFIIALHKDFQVDIPEKDYPQLLTLDSVRAYLSAALAKRGTAVTEA